MPRSARLPSRALARLARGRARRTVAIAYVLQKTTHVFPIVGGRKVEHLMDNIEALKISLTSDQIKRMESVLPFDLGFPLSMIGDGTQPSWLMKTAGQFDRWPLPEPIRPAAN